MGPETEAVEVGCPRLVEREDVRVRDELSMTEYSAVYTTEEGDVYKRPHRKSDCAHELAMMLRAGAEVCLPVVAVVQTKGAALGFIVPWADAVRPSALSRHQKADATRSLCALVDQLHRRGIVHGDLKLDNVGVLGSGGMRLLDMGSSFETERPRGATPSSLMWDAPGRHLSPGYAVSAKDDYHALGVTIWELWTGLAPGHEYPDEDDEGYDDAVLDEVELAVAEGRIVDTGEVDDPAARLVVTRFIRDYEAAEQGRLTCMRVLQECGL